MKLSWQLPVIVHIITKYKITHYQYLILHNREFRSFGNGKNCFKSTRVTFQGNDVRIYLCLHCITVKIIHMNLAVKFNLLKDTQPHYIYKPESCLENDNYKLYFDRTVLTDIHIQHNRPDIIILNKQQKQAYLLDMTVPNFHNITQTYNTKINKYLELSVAMRNLWSLEKISILPLIISATGIVPQSLFKNLKILDLENTLVVEIQKGIHIIVLMSYREEIP
jgi:hypothetical protein